MEERLQKILSRYGVSSRRSAEELIKQGRVAVNGEIVTSMGSKADPDRDSIVVDGKPLPTRLSFVYVALNKPKGYVTTTRDPQKRPVITDLIKDLNVRLYPVGRLDYDTEGLIFLTNDGDFAWKLQHPRFKISKTYLVEVEGRPKAKDIEKLRRGIVIEGKKTLPAGIKWIRTGDQISLLEVVIKEGRKRQIRKMFASIGNEVRSLRRTAISDIAIGGLPPGQYRFLEQAELDRLKQAMGE